MCVFLRSLPIYVYEYVHANQTLGQPQWVRLNQLMVRFVCSFVLVIRNRRFKAWHESGGGYIFGHMRQKVTEGWWNLHNDELLLLLLLLLSGITTLYESEPPQLWGYEITQKVTPQSVRLFWTSDQPVAETSTWKQHNTHKRQTSMPSAGFESATSVTDLPQAHSLDRSATGVVWACY